MPACMLRASPMRAPCLAPALCIAHSHATALHAMRAGWTGRKEACRGPGWGGWAGGGRRSVGAAAERSGERKPRGSRAAHKMQRAKQVETVCQLHSKDSSFKEAAAAARRGGRRGEGSRRHAARLGCGAGGGHAGAGSAVLPARMAARSRDDCALAHQALCCPLAAYADGCAATGAWLGLGLHGVLILSHLSA